MESIVIIAAAASLAYVTPPAKHALIKSCNFFNEHDYFYNLSILYYMSVHQRIKIPTNKQITSYRNIVSLYFYTSLYGAAGVAGLILLYLLKSAIGIDLIPGWSLFH